MSGDYAQILSLFSPFFSSMGKMRYFPIRGRCGVGHVCDRALALPVACMCGEEIGILHEDR